MPVVRRTAEARKDLLGIWAYIAEDSPETADRVLARIDETCDLAATQPHMGQARPDLAPEVRSLPVGPHMVFYRPIQSGIEVLMVVHGSRDIPTLFDERFD